MARLQPPINPNGCHWCGEDRERHVQLWHPEVGWHQWVEPTDEQRKERLLQRRDATGAERPDLSAWRRRQAQRESNAAQPIPSGMEYKRKPKNEREQEKRDG
jgi:hypothetical protein